MTETEAQERLIAYLREVLPCYGRRVFAVPNEREHTGSKAKKVMLWRALQRKGASPGCPDLLIPGPPPLALHLGGLALEMKKDKKSKWQPGQVPWLLYYNAIGWIGARCNGLDDALRLVRGFGYVEK